MLLYSEVICSESYSQKKKKNYYEKCPKWGLADYKAWQKTDKRLLLDFGTGELKNKHEKGCV